MNVQEAHLSLDVGVKSDIQPEVTEMEPKDRRRFLKVKLKSLAAESKIIRLEETRSQGSLRDQLCAHRRGVVRSEARSTHLAYNYIRGRSYKRTEPNPQTLPDWGKVGSMIKKYGALGAVDGLKKWYEAA